ncbi:hypothetical protein TNIN_380531 [Trichonephila inaurata madagascariensis]|uniref:Uncharacterized protein n=1 Tax=Trichonephila inaurata madagascariensis TaxID=2747483 RepID=A0A8X6IAL6_9ARAC|nr:hypothetical protein TNIN_380531 [Trichonephila inaurata madagascariensis]
MLSHIRHINKDYVKYISLSASEPDLTKNYLFEKLHNGKTLPRATMENTTISTARRLLALKGSPAVSDDQGTQVKIKLPDAIHSSTTEMKKASTTTQATTESSTIEITSETTIESTTEETTTTESTTLETTEETTTESTTVETTESTTMETTEATTIETTLETTSSETLMKPTSKSLLKTNSPNVPDQTENVNTTKSWQKYLSKSTPKPIHSTQSPVKDPKSLSNKPLFSKLIPNPSTSLTGIKSVNKDPKQTVDKNSTPRTTDKKSTPSNIVFQNKSQKEDATEINIRAPSTNQETTATTPSSNNSSVNISIDVDIDVNLRSHYTSASPNTSAEYISYDPDGTESPKDREKRYENKRIVAGVILVVLVSLSAGCALLLVIMPSNYDVVSRKYRTRPDQVALIPPRNRCRPRFYDSSLYMGH